MKIFNGLITLAIIGGICALVVWVYQHQKKEHAKKLADYTQYAASKNWGFREKGSDLLERFRITGLLKSGARNEQINWVFNGNYQGYNWIACEYFATKKGVASDRTQFIYRTIVSVTLPCDVPMLTLTTETLGNKLAAKFGKTDLQLGNEWFDKQFRITAQHEQFARDVLSPTLMDWMVRNSNLVPSVGLYFHGSELICWTYQKMEILQIEMFIQYMTYIISLIPPQVWQTARPVGQIPPQLPSQVPPYQAQQAPEPPQYQAPEPPPYQAQPPSPYQSPEPPPYQAQQPSPYQAQPPSPYQSQQFPTDPNQPPNFQ